MVARYRPGPLDSGMHDAFVERKNVRVAVTHLLPELEPILKDTYGVILYQEQVMNIACVLADYSMAEADNLRKAMGKKIGEIMAQERERFLIRAKDKGVDLEKAGKIFDLMEKFGRYGFNKAHSAAYAMIAFQTLGRCTGLSLVASLPEQPGAPPCFLFVVSTASWGVVCVCGEKRYSKAQPCGRQGDEAYLVVLVA